ERLRGGLKATRLGGRVDSIAPHLDQARMAVVAERLGGGFKLKVLDYVFNRPPVAALDGSVAGTPPTPNDRLLTFQHHRPAAGGRVQAEGARPRLQAPAGGGAARQWRRPAAASERQHPDLPASSAPGRGRAVGARRPRPAQSAPDARLPGLRPPLRLERPR